MNSQKTATSWENAIDNPFNGGPGATTSTQRIATQSQSQYYASVSQPTVISQGYASASRQVQNGNILSENVQKRVVYESSKGEKQVTFAQQATPQLSSESGLFASTQFANPSGMVQHIQNNLGSQGQTNNQNYQYSSQQTSGNVQRQSQPRTTYSLGYGSSQSYIQGETSQAPVRISHNEAPTTKQYQNDAILIQNQGGVSSYQKVAQTNLQSTAGQQTTSRSSGVHYQTLPANVTSSVASVSGQPRTSIRVGEGRVVGERIGEPRIIKEETGQSRIISTQALQSHIVEERTVQGASKIVSEVETRVPRMSEKRQVNRHEVEVEIVKRDKIIEILKEKPVPVERIVDVPYDVIVDIPIERTIEKEKITNIVREKPIEKIVEVPISQIIERPVEKIIEQPVEVQKFVEVPVERIVQRPYEVIKENVTFQDRYLDIDEKEVGKYPQFDRLPTEVKYEERQKIIEKPRYVDNIIEQIRPIERQKVIEVPRERITENKQQVVIDRPKQVEKVIHREVEVPVERTVYKDTTVMVERPVYKENIIEVPVPVERIKEKEVTVPVDYVVEKRVKIEQIVQNPVEHIVEIPIPQEEIIEEIIEQIEEQPYEVEQAVIRPAEKIIRRSACSVKKVEVPKEYPIEKLVAKPVHNTISRTVNKYSESKVESAIERPVYIERTVEVPKYIDKVIEVPVDRIVENIKYVEKIIEKPVYIDTVIEKYVEVIKEKIVEVPVEKIIQVEVEIITEVPQIEEVLIEEEIQVEGLTEVAAEGPVEESNLNFEDEVLAQQIKLRQLELETLSRKNKELNAELQATQQEIDRLAANLSNPDERENFKLLSRFAELNSRLRMEIEHGQSLKAQKSKQIRMVDGIVQKNPIVDEYRARIQALVLRNQQLCAKLKSNSEDQLKKVRYSQYRA